jgi:hypothetical protein
MHRLRKLSVTVSLAVMLLPSAAQAMDIIQFDLMTAKDRQAFLDYQSVAAETVLNQEGRSADAAKVHVLFNDIRPGDNLPVGEAELELNLAASRVRDDEKQIKNHDAPRVQVEVALAIVLKKNGFAITSEFIRALMQQTGTFQRSLVSLKQNVVLPLPPQRTAPPAASHPAPADDDPIGSGGFITPPKR